MSEIWSRLHPGAVAFADSDGDGASDFLESIAGTDPFDSQSLLRITSVETLRDPAVVKFHWQAVNGKRYAIDGLDPQDGGWTELETLISTETGPASLQLPIADPSAIFRLRVGDIDADGDGLTAWEEALLGLSDASPASSTSSGRPDFSTAFRRLEGEGDLTLSDGRAIPKRLPTRTEAVRFLAQSSFGADEDLIVRVTDIGIGAWLDEQLNPTVTTNTYAAMTGNGAITPSIYPYQWSRGWWRAAMTGPDQVRQRMGYALSQILVVSCSGNDFIRQSAPTQAVYYDILLSQSLGNYRQLLEKVSYSTQMGFYLSHLRNRRSDPALNRFPDENYAREIMQLFTIGLWELNPDGSRKLDDSGQPIPTYDNTTIMEMAKVFTGLSFGGTATTFFTPVNTAAYLIPMKMWDEEHEPGEKILFGETVIPAGQTGAKDISDALDILCAHPNTAPFLSRQLIQRFTASHPSPDYIRRVSQVWENNGSGVSGDLKAVMEAILMDPEARNPATDGDIAGKIREPYLRTVALMRAFKARNSRTPPTFPVVTQNFPTILGQQPLWAPSVFNFYSPDYRPVGELRAQGITAPELEIATASRMIETDNFLQRVIDRGMDPFTTAAADILHLDFTTALALSSDSSALVDYLDELLTWGTLSPSTRSAVTAAVNAQPSPELKVETAVHLIIESPDFVVLK